MRAQGEIPWALHFCYHRYAAAILGFESWIPKNSYDFTMLPKEPMMPSPDALAERKMISLDVDAEREAKLAKPRNGINNEHDDIAHDRAAIQEISLMADRMTSLLQETRNNTVEADERLRKVEEDLRLIALEK